MNPTGLPQTSLARLAAGWLLLSALATEATAQVPDRYNLARGLGVAGLTVMPVTLIGASALATLDVDGLGPRRARRVERLTHVAALTGMATVSPLLSGSARWGSDLLVDNGLGLPTAPGRVGLTLSVTGAVGLATAYGLTIRDKRPLPLWLTSCLVAGTGMALGMTQWGLNEVALARSRQP